MMTSTCRIHTPRESISSWSLVCIFMLPMVLACSCRSPIDVTGRQDYYVFSRVEVDVGDRQVIDSEGVLRVESGAVGLTGSQYRVALQSMPGSHAGAAESGVPQALGWSLDDSGSEVEGLDAWMRPVLELIRKQFVERKAELRDLTGSWTCNIDPRIGLFAGPKGWKVSVDTQPRASLTLGALFFVVTIECSADVEWPLPGAITYQCQIVLGSDRSSVLLERSRFEGDWGAVIGERFVVRMDTLLLARKSGGVETYGLLAKELGLQEFPRDTAVSGGGDKEGDSALSAHYLSLLVGFLPEYAGFRDVMSCLVGARAVGSRQLTALNLAMACYFDVSIASMLSRSEIAKRPDHGLGGYRRGVGIASLRLSEYTGSDLTGMSVGFLTGPASVQPPLSFTTHRNSDGQKSESDVSGFARRTSKRTQSDLLADVLHPPPEYGIVGDRLRGLDSLWQRFPLRPGRPLEHKPSGNGTGK